MIKRLFSLLVFLGIVLAAWMLYFSNAPIPMRAESTEIDLKAGSSLRSVGQQLVDQKVLNEPWSFVLMVRLLGAAGSI